MGYSARSKISDLGLAKKQNHLCEERERQCVRTAAEVHLPNAGVTPMLTDTAGTMGSIAGAAANRLHRVSA